MKYVGLLFKSITLMFKRSRVAFILYLVVQVIISLGFVFFFTTVYTSRENYVKETTSARMLIVDANDVDSPQNGKEFVANLCNNTPAALSRVTFTFALSSDKYSKGAEVYYAYLNPERLDDSINGRNISQADIENRNLVLVSENYNLDFNKDKKNYNIGDTVSLDGLEFTVIGNGPSNQIPYTVGFDRFTLKNLYLSTSADATDNQRAALGDFIKKQLPDSTVRLPAPLAQKVMAKTLLPFAAAFLVGISALVSLLFIFKYMLESSRKDHYVFKICGCGEKRLFFILFGELALLFTLSYTVGAFLFVWLRKIFEANEIFVNSQLHFLHVALIYLASVLIIAIIMVPYLLKNRRLPLNSGGAV